MADLIAVTFDDESTGFDLRADLVRLQKEYLLSMEDAVVVTHDEEGRVKLHQSTNLTATGAIGGSFWGLLIGLLFMNPLAGLLVGAGAGALSGALSDIGIDDGFMRDLGEKLRPGTSAVFLLVDKMTGDKVLDRLGKYREKGHVLQTSLSHDDEATLRDFLERAKAG